jgi:hypothetical protein
LQGPERLIHEMRKPARKLSKRRLNLKRCDSCGYHGKTETG